ncbi:hypothetical protein FRC00_000525 [Tulasnella sp. 408]|nr:hypothetical protein FRC00_000525 [Tulasnella sp. 408]
MLVHEWIPREIFETILHRCVGFETPVRDLVTLQLVCRTWHDIIAETSFLWGTITTSEGSQAYKKALQMAKDSLLDVIFVENDGETKASEFFRLTGEKIHQWKSFTVKSETVEEALALVQTQKPPKLESLRVISGRKGNSIRGEIILFGGDPSAGLKDIELRNVPVNLTALRLSGLKSLILKYIPSITTTEILELLANSPTLEVLHLSRLKGAVLPTQPATSEPSPSSHSAIQLPSLIKMRLYYLPLDFLTFLLSTSAVPQLRSLRVGCRDIYRPGAQLLDVIMRHLNQTLISITSGAQEYQVTVHTLSHYEITIRGLSIALIWESTGADMLHFQKTFNWLSDHLEGVDLEVIPLHLILEGDLPNLSCFEWFTRRTNVTRLTFSNHPDYEFNLPLAFQWLSRPPSMTSPIWLLPQLEFLDTDVACTRSQAHIVNTIKARHSAVPNSSEELGGARVPKRFREIRLDHNGYYFPMPEPLDNFMSEVVQAAEGADVYWAGSRWKEIYPLPLVGTVHPPSIHK